MDTIQSVYIKEIGRGVATVYSAIPLDYSRGTQKYIKPCLNYKVALKCLHNSQNITEFLNEV